MSDATKQWGPWIADTFRGDAWPNQRHVVSRYSEKGIPRQNLRNNDGTLIEFATEREAREYAEKLNSIK